MAKKQPADPALYVNARGWLRVLNTQLKMHPIWVPVICNPQYNCGRMDLLIRPVDGIGEQCVWKTRVWFEDDSLNLCEDRPTQEDLDAYAESKRIVPDDDDVVYSDGFIVEDSQ